MANPKHGSRGKQRGLLGALPLLGMRGGKLRACTAKCGLGEAQ
jgi:hypothetical protein